MNILRKIAAVSTMLVVATALFAGGQSEDVSVSEKPSQSLDPVYGGRLNVAVGSVTYLDPMFESVDEPMGRHMFETVLSLDGDYNVYPGVCNYEISDDFLSITLTVRDGMTFHDGTKVEAEDVAASLKRWVANISNGKTFIGNYLDGIDVIGDTVVLSFNQVASAALAGMGYEYMGAFVMPSEICEKYPDSAVNDVNDLIGTGPYKLKEWVVDSYVLEERYEDYVPTGHDCSGPAGTKMAYADEICFYFVTDSDAAVNGVMSGTYDLARNVNYSIYLSQQDNEAVKFALIHDGTRPSMVFDNSEGWTANITFRQAVQACVDCEAVMLASFGTEDLFNLTGAWYYDLSSDLYNENNMAKAKKLLAESGYDGTKLTFLTSEGVGYYYTTALITTQLMQEAGINVELKIVDLAELYSIRNNPESFDFFSVGFTMKADPGMLAFLSDSWPGWWVSEKKSELMNKMAATLDQDEKKSLWKEMTDLMYTEVPIVSYGRRANCTLTTARVMDASYYGSEPYYWNIWLAE